MRLVALAVVFLALTGLGCAQAERVEPFFVGRNAFDPEAAAVANERGLTLATEGEFEAAEQAFAEAVRANKGYAAAHNNLGLVLLERVRFYESARAFTMAIRLDPRAVEPLINLGRLYETVGWGRDAAKQYETALDLQPEHREAMARLAHVSALSGIRSGSFQGPLDRLASSLMSEEQVRKRGNAQLGEK